MLSLKPQGSRFGGAKRAHLARAAGGRVAPAIVAPRRVACQAGAMGPNKGRAETKAKAVAFPMDGPFTEVTPYGLADFKDDGLVNGRANTKMIRIKVDDTWYDATGWAKAHPGGAMFVEFMNNRDATEVFYALHSYGPNGAATALERLNKLPKVEGPMVDTVPTSAMANFRAFRQQLEKDGWFDRNWVEEVKIIIPIVALAAVGTWLAPTYPVLAAFLIGVAMQQSGWSGHDYIHGRGKWCSIMNWWGGGINGHSAEWWRVKHSLHHSFTNEVGKDGDVMMEPVLFLEDPSKSGRPDAAARKFQHLYVYTLLYPVTFAFWRFESLVSLWKDRTNWARVKEEVPPLVLNYCWLAYLGPAIAISSVLVAGFLVGAIVSATHQSEELMHEQEPDYVKAQFNSTRDADVSKNKFVQWLWGGMDTQLEHHLFPSMPRYKYHKLRPLVQQFAAANNLDYRISTDLEIIKMNFETMADVARAD